MRSAARHKMAADSQLESLKPIWRGEFEKHGKIRKRETASNGQ